MKLQLLKSCHKTREAYSPPVDVRFKLDNMEHTTLQDLLLASLPSFSTLDGCPVGLWSYSWQSLLSTSFSLSYLHPPFCSILLHLPVKEHLTQCSCSKKSSKPTLPASAGSLASIDLGHQLCPQNSTLALQLLTLHACHCTLLSRSF